MSCKLQVRLLKAMSASMLGPNTIVRVLVRNIRESVLKLAKLSEQPTIPWMGNDQRADVWGNGWHIELVASEPTSPVLKLRKRLDVLNSRFQLQTPSQSHYPPNPFARNLKTLRLSPLPEA